MLLSGPKKTWRRKKKVFVNVYGAQDSIPRNRFRQARNQFLGFLKGLQIYGLRLHKLVEHIFCNLFLGSLKSFKFRLSSIYYPFQ